MEAAQSLKNAGNALFRSRQWAEAAGKYSEALAALTTARSPDERKLKGTLLANRAACTLKIGPVDTDAVVKDCSAALDVYPRYPKAFMRRAKAYFEKGSSELNPELSVEILSKAMQDVRMVMKADPQSAPARGLLGQIQRKVQAIQDSGENYVFYLKRALSLLRTEAKDTTSPQSLSHTSRDIRLVMNAYLKSSEAANRVLSSRFPELLSTLALEDKEAVGIKEIPRELQLEASRALSAVLGSRHSLTNSLESLLYIPPSEFVQTVVERLSETTEFRHYTKEQLQDYLEIVQSLVRVCQRIIVRKEGKSSRVPYVEGMAKLINRGFDSEEQLLSTKSEEDESTETLSHISARISTFLESMVLVGTLDEKTIEVVREQVFKVLFHPSIVRVRPRDVTPSVLNAVLVATGKTKENKKRKGDGSDEQQASLSEHYLRMPKEHWEGNDIKSLAFAREWGFKLAGRIAATQADFLAACTVLSIILQANPPLGVFLITSGGLEKTAEKPSVVNANKQQGEENRTPPPILQALVQNAGERKVTLRRASLSVLALASQDRMIRTSIEKGNILPMFLELVDFGMSPKQNTIDTVVLCHAIIAIAKQVAISEDARRKVLDIKEGTPSLISTSMKVLVWVSEKVSQHESNEGKRDSGKPLRSKSLSEDSSLRRTRIIENLAVEGIVFLSLVGKFKELFLKAKQKNGVSTKRFALALFRLLRSSNRAARFGIIQAISSFMKSSEDKQRDYNKELSKLRQMASKGLGKDQSEELSKVAGPPSLIKETTHFLVNSGVVDALVKCIEACKKECAEENTEDNNAEKKKKKGYYKGMSEAMIEAIAFCMKKIAQDERNRGILVQQRGLRLLGDLYCMGAAVMDAAGGPDSKKGMWREDCAVSLARVAITTDPKLYPTGTLSTMIRPLLWLFGGATHELHQFEAGMGLTNIASFDEDTRDVLVINGAWSAVTNLLTSENEEVQRTGIEFMTNLIVCEKSIQRLQQSEQEVKIFLMFAKANNLRMQLAATGGLAMMSQDPLVAQKILKLGGKEVLKDIASNTSEQGVLLRARAALENLEQANGAPEDDARKGEVGNNK